MEKTNNSVLLCGALAGRPEFSHATRNERYFIFPMEIERLSKVSDYINIIVREEILKDLEVEERTHVCVLGELRSFNNRSGVGSKLVITVFAHEVYLADEEDKNEVNLTGALCRPPNLRRTPMGREICDMMLAVNRRYGRSDYLPCIAWGRIAEEAAKLCIGDVITITGRIQSRKYIKTQNDEVLEKTAFEVSLIEMTV